MDTTLASNPLPTATPMLEQVQSGIARTPDYRLQKYPDGCLYQNHGATVTIPAGHLYLYHVWLEASTSYQFTLTSGDSSGIRWQLFNRHGVRLLPRTINTMTLASSHGVSAATPMPFQPPLAGWYRLELRNVTGSSILVTQLSYRLQ